MVDLILDDVIGADILDPETGARSSVSVGIAKELAASMPKVQEFLDDGKEVVFKTTKGNFSWFELDLPLSTERPPPTVSEDDPAFWEARGFNREEAEAIADWVTQNQQTPSAQTINQILIDAGLREPEEKGWLEKIKDFLVDNPIVVIDPQGAALKLIYETITGKELTDEEFLDLRISIVDFLTNANTWSILFTGKNLAGEEDEVTDAETAIATIDTALLLFPIGKLGSLASKIGLKFGGKAVLDTAARAALRKATPAEIEAILKTGNFKYVFEAVRNAPGEWAKLAPKFTKETQALISATLKKQHPQAASRLFEEAVLNAERAKVPISTSVLNFIKANKGKGIVGAIMTAWGIMGFEAFTNWPLVDNVGFLKFNEAKAIQTEFENGNITREEALEELDKIVELLDDIVTKLKVSSNWNPLMAVFGQGFVLTADENLATAQRIRDEVAGAEVPVKTERVIIRAEPANAEINVQGQFPATGVFDEELPVGNYEVIVSEFDHIPQNFFIDVVEGSPIDRTIVLDSLPDDALPPSEASGNLNISVVPSDALIQVAGHPEITAAGSFKLTPGSKDIRASKEGFVTDTKTAFVRSDEDAEVSFLLEEIIEPEAKATISVLSEPVGAKIYIDDVFTFEETDTALQVLPGTHKLTLKLSGFKDREESFAIAEGETKSFSLGLSPLEIPADPGRSKIKINSEPTGADIWINGEFKFTTTPFTILLDPGEYVFKVELAGFQPQEITAEVEPGDDAEILFSLVTSGAPPEVQVITIPPADQPAQDFDLLFPPDIARVDAPQITAPTQKELMINIETTDLNPWDGRIFSIAFQDLSTPNAEVQVLTGNDELELITNFLEMFEAERFSKLVGYNVSFDYRFIFSRLWFYRLQSRLLKEVQLRDVMQIMKQVKEEFVFTFQKPGTLDSWGKYLLGVGKLSDQEVLFREYLAGNFEFVRDFQTRQIELTNGLYVLARHSFGEGFIVPQTTISEPVEAAPVATSTPNPSNPNNKQCKNCLAFNQLDASKCEICGSSI